MGESRLRKYILLILSICLLIYSLWLIYDIHQPKVGPIGNGEIPTIFWVTISCNITMALVNITLAINWFIKENKERKAIRQL